MPVHAHASPARLAHMIASVHTHEEWAAWGRQMRDENERLREALRDSLATIKALNTHAIDTGADRLADRGIKQAIRIVGVLNA